MKVKATTEEMVVIDLENEPHAIDEESVVHFFPDLMVPKIVRIYKDRLELDVEVVGCKRKTLKIYFHDAILMNRVLHKICGRKLPSKEG